MRLWLRAAATMFACWAMAAYAGAAPCGTAVIPNGIGQGEPTSPTSLNPLLNSNIETLQAAVLLYRPLVWLGRGGVFDRERSLAASVEPLDGNTRFRVTLKPWRWSDGDAVTADDVLYAWNLIVQLGDGFAWHQGGVPDAVAAVRAVSPLVVDFELKAPLNPDWFIRNGLPVVYALPKHAWAAISRDAMWQRQSDATMFAVSDGPFVLREWQLQRFMVYTPNPYYGGHKAALARLVVVFPEYSNPVRSLRAGELDMARLPFPLLERLRDTPGFHTVVLPEPFGYNALAFNQASGAAPFLRDARVRRALTDATDQRAIIRLVYHGLAGENRVPVPFTASAWRSPAVQAGTLPVRYDPDLARRELDAAGWHAGQDGVRRQAGRALAFSVLTEAASDGVQMQALQMLREELAAIGVTINPRPMPFDQLAERVSDQGSDWDAAVLPQTLQQGVPDGTGSFDTNGVNNYGGFSDPTMDRLIPASVREPGTEAMFAYEDYAALLQPVNILPQGRYVLMVANRLHGVEEFASEYGRWSPEYLSVADPACAVALGAGPGR